MDLLLTTLCETVPQVITIEGVQDNARVAASLASHNGSQCGFCSPGMVMSMQGLLAQTKVRRAQSLVFASSLSLTLSASVSVFVCFVGSMCL